MGDLTTSQSSCSSSGSSYGLLHTSNNYSHAAVMLRNRSSMRGSGKSTSTIGKTNDANTNSGKEGRVSFGHVIVRQHSRIMGDHPSCGDHLPLALDWNRVGTDEVIPFAHIHPHDHDADALKKEQMSRCTAIKGVEAGSMLKTRFWTKEREEEEKEKGEDETSCASSRSGKVVSEEGDPGEEQEGRKVDIKGKEGGNDEDYLDQDGRSDCSSNNSSYRLFHVRDKKPTLARRLSYDERRRILLEAAHLQKCHETHRSITQSDRRIRRRATLQAVRNQATIPPNKASSSWSSGTKITISHQPKAFSGGSCDKDKSDSSRSSGVQKSNEKVNTKTGVNPFMWERSVSGSEMTLDDSDQEDEFRHNDAEVEEGRAKEEIQLLRRFIDHGNEEDNYHAIYDDEDTTSLNSLCFPVTKVLLRLLRANNPRMHQKTVSRLGDSRRSPRVI